MKDPNNMLKKQSVWLLLPAAPGYLDAGQAAGAVCLIQYPAGRNDD